MISFFARNPVASNLLMLAIAAAGLFTLLSGKITLEVYPDFPSDTISVSIPYPGATPEETEEVIVIRAEEAITEVPGIKRITSRASNSNGQLTIEVENTNEIREVLSDIKARIDSISTFPADAERPVVAINERPSAVIAVVLSGDLTERELKTLAEKVRDDIINLPEVTAADVQGVREYEITLEISEETLQRYGLTLTGLATTIRQASADFSAGVVRSTSGDITIRTRGRAYQGSEFAEIPIATGTDGTRIRLGDIATISDGFTEEEFLLRFDGRRATFVVVFLEPGQNAIKIANAVRTHMEATKHKLPHGVAVNYTSDRSQIVRNRLATLIDSGWKSILLVLLLLTLFLRPGLALWVTLGIPICMLGALSLFPLLGVSINIVSLFGFILVLGVVVDDAIVTGENIHTCQLKDPSDPHGAAIRGAQEVALPVIFGVLTTMLAFVPLLLDTEGRGRWQSQIAVVVICVLAFSLIESKLILPSHLRKLPKPPTTWLGKTFHHFQQTIANALEQFASKIYAPFLGLALKHRYLTLSIFLALILITIGIIRGPHMGFTLFPSIPSERATASLTMEEGTPYEVTAQAIDKITAAGKALQDKYGTKVIQHIITSSGGQGVARARGRGGIGQPNKGEVLLELSPAENRAGSPDTRTLTSEWRKAIGKIPGARTLTYRAVIFGGRNPIRVQLLSPTPKDLTAATTQIREQFTNLPGVFDVGDSLDRARDELQLRLLPAARHYGLTTTDLGRQVRQAYFGEEIQRIQRGRDDVRVRLRLPRADRENLAKLKNLRIHTQDGSSIPLSKVAQIIPDKSQSTILRIDRRRAATIDADYDKKNTDATALFAQLNTIVQKITDQYPAMGYSFEGEAKEARESGKAQRIGLYLLLFGLFALLAIPFKSYIQPLIVMSAIPFGAIGAVAGHLLLGMNLTILSIFGMLALAGVVVNDSLVLVDFINRKKREGMPALEAIRTSGAKRFRPILLTSITTFAGLAPLIFETSTQAQFLIPMAVSLGFGILFATTITLILIPTLYLVQEDAKSLTQKKA